MIDGIFHPSFVLVITGVLAALTKGLLRKIIQLAGPVIALIMLITMPVGTFTSLGFINGYELSPINVDELGWLFGFVVIFIALIGNIFALHKESPVEAVSSMVYASAALGVTLSGDLVTFIFCWELMTIAALLLIWDRKRPKSVKAGFRYLMVHMFGGNFMLAGILYKIFAYGSITITQMADTLDVGTVLMAISVLINAAAVPFHTWLVDAYPTSSTTGIVFLNAFTTKIAVFAMLRFFAGLDTLIWFGVIMAIYGACFAIVENDFRKLLSYHIISQVGFMVAAAGIGTNLAVNGAASLYVAHNLYKSVLLMCAGAIIYSTGIRKINELGGLMKKLPLVCIFFFIAAFSIAGAPPFGGFVSKPMIGEAAIEAGLPIVQLLLNVAGIGTMLSIPCKLGYYMFFAKPAKEVAVKKVPLNMTIAMGIGAACCVLLGLFPGVVYDRLPFVTGYEPYTVSAVTEYIQLLGAAVIPFIIMVKLMAPHSALTLDTDWFYRKPIPAFFRGLSKGLVFLQRAFGKVGFAIYNGFNTFINQKERPYNLDKGRIPIGYVMLAIVGAFFVIGGFLAVMTYSA